MEEKENLNRAVAVIRLSQDDSKNPSLSPLNQEKICRSYAKERGDEIIEVYKDIKTGTNLNRPSFQRLMRDARDGKFKRIYCKTWDRISRDIADMENTIKELSGLGIIVISCDGNNDPKQRQMMTMMAQWMIEDARKKIDMQHSKLIKDSESCTRPAFGYFLPIETQKFLPNGKKNLKFNPDAKKVFEVNEKEANQVKRMFEMRANGISMKEISKEFNRPVRGIYLMLKNKVYSGILCYKGIYYQGLHQPIIEELLFNKVQEKNKCKRRTYDI